ncbi:hypothetical protein [Bradyrhizobium sp.]|uniref:beta strand repeat-containing protein n=1 Tax=Bradyrhizobium sp. TaxID=376 RepID=UPI002621A0DB|nr:hypothetical protein [Bradyrhizobium sp.]
MTLVLDGGTKISGGKLLIHDPRGDDEGVVEIKTGGATFDDVAVTNNNQLIIDPLVTLTLTDNTSITGGTITDNGAIDVAGNSSITGTVTVNPHGPPTVVNANLNNGQVTIESGVTLTLNNVLVDGTILTGIDSTSTILVGSGTALGFDSATISGATLDLVGGLNSTGNSFITGATIINRGNIDIVSGTLTVDPTPTTNTGTIEVDANAGLVLSGEVVANSVTTKGHTANGTVQVDHNGLLTFDGGAIDGGIVNNFGGTIDVTAASSINDTSSFVNFGIVKADGAALTLTNTTVNNFNGTFETLGSNGILKLANTAINLGTLVGRISTSSGNISSTLNGGFGLFSGLTLELGTIVTAVVGVLELTGNIFNYGEIDANQGMGVAVNLDNVALYGGELGGLGTIATAAGNSDSVTSDVTIADHTTLMASAGQLELTGTISNGGEIDVTIPGKLVLDDATVLGGTLAGAGQISTAPFDFSGSTLEGVTIAHGTTVYVTHGTALELVGTIVDAGRIALNSFGDWTGLKISGNVALTGGGDVVMGDSSHNFIVSDGSAATLTNYDTISGAGAIGDSHLTLVNFGTIDANGTNKLIIDTGANLVANNHGGVLEASPGSALQIDGDVLNDGVIASGNASGHSGAFVDITGNITNTTGSTGAINIFAHSALEIGGAVSAGQTVTFEQANGAGLLILDDSHDFKGTIAGLVEANPENAENHVDLTDLAFSDTRHMHVSYSNSTHDVTITNTLSHDSVSLHVTIGSNFSAEFEIHSDGHGGTLLDDPSATGTNTIDSGDVLGISGASSAAVNFTNTSGNTGELLLNDSHDFTGTIAGFTGGGTTENSDLIDVTDINFANVATSKTTYAENANSTGTLTLYDVNGQAFDSINFSGNYQLANFTIQNDGNGGTLIVDPPVNSAAPASTVVASTPNQTLSGSASSENFVFHFANVGQSAISNFHPATDTLQVGSAIFADTQAALSAVRDDGHGNSVIAIDAHDSITLHGVAKAQLNAGDFHVV